MNEELEDMTEYVTDTLSWAQQRMSLLIQEQRNQDAVALGAEFISWADESDTVIVSSKIV